MTRRDASPPPTRSLAWGLALTAAVLAAALLSLAWTPHDLTAIDVVGRLRAPSPSHPFGTDAYGRDALSLVMGGARTALAVAVAACGVGLGLGVPLGLLAAARRGWTEALIQRACDVVFAFPALLSAIIAAATFGPGMLDAVLAIGIFSIPVFARVVHGAALEIWSRDFTLAARAAGCSTLSISVGHVLPNLLAPLAVQAAVQLALAVVAEAGLAYVGLSAQSPQPSWGRMLAEAQTLYLQAPWLAVFPGTAIVVTVLAFSLVGEGLRARFAAPGEA